MRKFRFFSERKNLRVGSSVKLNDFDANHVRKVLRLKKDDEIYIFNGETEFRAKLKMVTNDITMATILDEVSKATDNVRKVTLFQALIKQKAFELIIEKVTELGINKIIPFESDFSVVKNEYVKNKYDRWNKIIISACKQSERVDIPQLENSTSFPDMLEQLNEFDEIIAFIPQKDIKLKELFNLKDLSHESNNIAYIIGPEGGFSPSETKIIEEDKKIKVASLGNNILRAETAAIAGIVLLNN